MENKELLTGKTKIDFEQWYPQFYAHNLPNKNRYEEGFEKDPIWKRLAITFFHCKIPQEQQGVLLQFFRERGISITIQFGLTAGYYCEISEDDENDAIVLADFMDYNTAFTHAIDKACELYNGGEK